MTEPSRKPTLTVFIPTYNRAHLIIRALDSVVSQSVRDVEVLVVDDGSTDGTREIVMNWEKEHDLRIRYFSQPNQGKHVAHNLAISEACGEFFTTLDSDDQLAPDALAEFLAIWAALPEERRSGLAGVEGNCADLSGKVTGSRFPQDGYDSSYVETRYRDRVRGDKKSFLRTDILRDLPYPQFVGERFFRDSILWKRIGRSHKTHYVNRIFQLVEYQADGLSSNSHLRRMNNSRGLSYYYRENTDVHLRSCGMRQRYDSAVKYIRFSLCARRGLTDQWRHIESKRLWLCALPEGLLKCLTDYLRHRSILRSRAS